MARFDVTPLELALVFSPLEALGGLRSGARVPLKDIESVEVVDDPWFVISGMRFGTGVPGIIVLGTMLRKGANDVVAIYKHKPAVVVNLKAGASWQRLIATVPNAESVAASIKSHLEHLPH